MSRKQLAITSALVGVMLTFTGPALAQKRNPAATNAALQAREKMLQSHRQSGNIAGGYRPFSVWSYQGTARMQARALNAYGLNCPQVPPATAKEHLTEVRRNLTAATQELSRFGDDAAKQAEVKEHVDAIRKHHEAATKLCDRMEKAIGDNRVDCAEMCECCQGIDKELQAAEEEHRELMDRIGIKLPDAHDHGEHEHRPADKPPMKEGDKKSE